MVYESSRPTRGSISCRSGARLAVSVRAAPAQKVDLMNELRRIDLAGISIRLHEVHAVLSELRAVLDEFRGRADAFKADRRNPHLCRAGCDHCCKSGAVFAVTLAEAVQWAVAIEALPTAVRLQSRDRASALLNQQAQVFGEVQGSRDVPGERDEHLFMARVSKLNAASPACPLLVGNLCSTYQDRPMLCRAYGFPVDAYAVKSNNAIAFRSLCVLYEGMQLTDYVRAVDLKERLKELSHRLGGGRDWGRFTSLEAVLAQVG